MSCPLIPSRISVSVSGIPSRSEAAASGQVRSSSEASSSSRSRARWWSLSAHAPRIRTRTCGRSRSGSRSETFRSLWRWQRCTSACSPNTSLIALRSALPPSITNRIACSGSRPRSTRSASSIATSVAFSVLPSHSPSGIFTPSVEIPSATTCVRSAISKPVEHHHRQAHVIQPAAHQLAQRGPGPLDEQLRHRALRRRARLLLDLLTDRLADA